jgi:hypothetical protein
MMQSRNRYARVMSHEAWWFDVNDKKQEARAVSGETTYRVHCDP